MKTIGSKKMERRRSPRIPWRIPFVATWRPRKAVTVREQGWTEIVNADGALIRLSSYVKPGQPIDLQGLKGGPLERARVVGNFGMNKKGTVGLGIELQKPNLGFWVELAR